MADQTSQSNNVADGDPRIRQLNIPKNAIQELEQLVKTPPTKTDKPKVDCAPTNRFYTALITLITFGLLTLLVNWLAITGNQLLPHFAFLIGLLVWEWSNLHGNNLIQLLTVFVGNALTRRRRAFLNVRNVLDTYQIQNREFGHLFQADPPTPGDCCSVPMGNVVDRTEQQSPVKTVGQEMIQNLGSAPPQTAQFDKAVHDHYGGMYDNIKRINAEMQLLDKGNKANQDLGLAQSDAAKPDEKLVPVDIPLPGDQSKKEQPPSK
ncbi:hypothetical protein M3Y94_00518800 [Aphelenchoides besseyi]|nr:hypothetical protein M3Y94_00518800 [Aphelenchoides besseyi]